MKNRLNRHKMNKRIAGRLAGALGLLLTLCLLAGGIGVTPVLAVPNMPHQFYGSVTIGGAQAPTGTVITAKITGAPDATTTVDSSGNYNFQVPADDPDTSAVKEGGVAGDTIQFYVGTTAAQTGTFAYGGITQLNLTVTIPAPTSPAVTNSTGVGNLTSTSARLNGEVTSTGGENPTVHVYWGPSDGGTTTGSWVHDVNLGAKAAGTFYTDISSLTASTPYYYRCYAVNSGGASWAASTATFTTPAAPAAPQKLLGVDAGTTSSGVLPGSYFLLNRFQATGTGDVVSFKIKTSGSGNVKAAIYADNSGEPGALLSAVNTSTPVSAGWNDITITSTPVVTGSYYWLAYNSDTTIGYYQSAAGTLRYKTATFSSFSFPNPAGTGLAPLSNYVCLLAGWGYVIPPTPPTAPTVTNSTGASNIMPTSARLNGEVTSTGNENPTVHVYWGPSDGGTTPGSWANDVNLGAKAAGTFYTDISSLTASTPYYYRCYAVNSGGASWAASTATFTTLAAGATPQKLIGADDSAPSTGAYPGGYFFLYRFQAVDTGNVVTFKIKTSGSGNVKAAIYADNSGEPGALLSAVNTSTPVVAGWNSITITSTPVVTGTYYWLAYSSDSAIGYYYSTGGTFRYKTTTYSTFSFPNPAGTGFSSLASNGLLAGWGYVIPPTPPAAPTLVSPGAAITFKWSTSSGATKYYLQVNTNSSFTGTSMFDAELGNVTLQEVTGLTLGTTYYWRVKAGNAGGWSSWSSVRSVIANELP